MSYLLVLTVQCPAEIRVQGKAQSWQRGVIFLRDFISVMYVRSNCLMLFYMLFFYKLLLLLLSQWQAMQAVPIC